MLLINDNVHTVCTLHIELSAKWGYSARLKAKMSVKSQKFRKITRKGKEHSSKYWRDEEGNLGKKIG